MKDPNDLSQFPAEIVETVTDGGTRIDCEHGQLKRQCPLCEKDEEIERLRAKNQRQRAALEVARNHISGKAGKFSERERTPVLFQINEALRE